MIAYFSYYLITNNESRVECINPKIVSAEDYENVKVVLDRSQELLDTYMNMIKQRTVEMDARAAAMPILQPDETTFRTRISAFGKKISSIFVKR